MNARSLFDAVIEPGFRSPNFFEGRLLTAQDLRDEQIAHRERQRLLGRAFGAGVADGLTVTLEPGVKDGRRKTVTIREGYAINGEGELLWLKSDLTVDVVPQTVVPEPPAALFRRCEADATPAPTVPVGVGLHVIVMAPASGFRERAPMSGLGSEGIVTGCGDRYAVEGVRFRLETLDLDVLSGGDATLRAELVTLLTRTDDAARRSLLRSLAAHQCFGPPELEELAADPFARTAHVSPLLDHGAVDRLRQLKRLTACEVPLALLLWDDSGIAFLDLWSVRRRPVPPARSTDWPVLAGERATIEGEARWLQFQEHVAGFSDASKVEARTWFRHLPAAGLLPVSDVSSTRFDAATFFQGITVRWPRPPRHEARDGPVVLEGSRLPQLMRDSFVFPPFATTAKTGAWLYRIRENRFLADTRLVGAPGPYVVFTSGQMPYYASPRFDVARWDYGNYSSFVLGPGAL